MSVYKRRGKWFCDITIDGRRVQRVLKKARTRAQAIKATTVIENNRSSKPGCEASLATSPRRAVENLGARKRTK